jgi:hypothetical protein
MAYHPRTMNPNEPKNGIVSNVNAGDCLCTLGLHKAETRKLNKAAAKVVTLSFTGDRMLLGSRMAAWAGIAVGWKASGPVELMVILEKKSIFAILETRKVLSLPASAIYTHEQGLGNANLRRHNKKKGPTKQVKSEYWA